MLLRPGWTGRATRLAGTVAVLAGLTACSALDGSTRGSGTSLQVDAADPRGSGLVVSGAGAPGSTSGSTPRLVLRSRVTRVAGHLSDVRRERVARHARASVEDYLERAFVTEDHPFRELVPQLRRAARADAPVLRGAGEVGVIRAAAWFAVAAPHGQPVGLTARIAVDLPAGSSVTGRLLLTEHGHTWRVFGYDVARGER